VTSENLDDELKRTVASTQEENRMLRTVISDLEDKETKLQVSGPPSFSYFYDVSNGDHTSVENVATRSIRGVVYRALLLS
jgi:hypothetical protein